MTSRSFPYVVIFVSIGWLMVSAAWAHRDRGPNDPCRKQIGDSLLHLTLYQPHFDPDAEYCEEVPRAGKTIIVIDVTAGELRQVPIRVELIVRGESGQSRSVVSLPPQVYERGVADSEVVLNEGSVYDALVAVDLGAGRGLQSFSFPIRVAAWYTAMIKPVLMVLGLLVLTTISVIRYQLRLKQEESSVGSRKVRRVAN